MDISPVEPVVEPAPLPRSEPFWDYTDLMLVIGFIVASIAILVFAAGVLVAVVPRLREDPGPLLLPLQIALYAFVYLALRVTLSMRYHQPVFRSLGWRPSNLNPGIAMVGGAILAFAVSLVASVLHTPKVPSPIDQFVKTPLDLVLFAILAVTVAPLFEELFFRGFLQPLLSRSFGVAAGVVLTAIIFGSLHAPEYSWAWQYALAVSLAGVVFGWVRERTKSIIPSTIMHGCYNGVFVIALLVSKELKH